MCFFMYLFLLTVSSCAITHDREKSKGLFHPEPFESCVNHPVLMLVCLQGFSICGHENEINRCCTAV